MSRICHALEVSKSNLYEQRGKEQIADQRQRVCPDDPVLLPLIENLLKQRPTYGYRRMTALLRKATGRPLNPKRVYRIMRQHHLLLQKYTPRPVRVHEGKVMTLKSNLRWCSDSFAIQCWNGEQVAVAFIEDCHDREIIAWIASKKGINGQMIRDLMLESVEKRFGPCTQLPHKLQFLSDNGPQYVARETVYFGVTLGFEMCTTAPYSPESNGMAEAFVKTFKRDYVYVGDLKAAEIVLQQLPEWFEHYNNHAPHKGLKMLAPRAYLRQPLGQQKKNMYNQGR